MSDSEHSDEELDLSDDTVVTKYKTAAGICNRVIVAVRDACKPGARLAEIADIGDDMIEKECGNVYKTKKDMQKGIAFPTCLSVDQCASGSHIVDMPLYLRSGNYHIAHLQPADLINANRVCAVSLQDSTRALSCSCVGHYSPLADDTHTLKAGSVVKIDLGAHIDGFVAVQATTVVVQDSAEPITGRVADALACANTCFEAALRLIRPGKHASDVPGPLNKIAEAYGCTMVEGVMTHNMKQFVIDGNKCVLNKPTAEQKVDDNEFEEHEVYAVDIVVSTGEGKAKMIDEKATTVYKRALSESYALKMKASRQFLSEVMKRYPCLPFPLRKLVATGSTSKFGLVECVNHNLLQSYPVLWEKEGEVVAHIKGTVLLMTNGSDRITSVALQEHTSEKSVQDEEIKKLLQQSLKAKKKTNKKKKGAGTAIEGAEQTTEA